MIPALLELFERLTSAGRVSADDVLALRAKIYGADSLAPDAMEALGALEAAPGERAPEWSDLLAEAMVDFAVHQEDPQDYVDDAKAAFVMRVFAGDVRAESGLECLVRILEAATEVPPALSSFVLQKATTAMCAKGRIAAADVALMRRLVFSGGGDGNLAVTRNEGDTLFAIHDAARGAFNDPAWSDFFAEAVGAAVLAASPYVPEAREAALRDEAWLDHKDTLGEFASRMAAKPDLKGAIRDILHPGEDVLDEWQAADAKFAVDEAAAGKITDDDARWLVGHLSRSRLTEPERRLLAFLKAEASEVSDLLKPLLDAAELQAPLAPALAGAPPQPAPAPARQETAPGPGEPAPGFGLRRTPAA
ncbi:MAG TPA: hypothetical protein VMU37_09870 [Caulobacteraceae bacterium]|nr:hypothetical protein [Caulobacteraceae bacterium]